MIAHLIFSFFTSGTSSLIKPNNINNSYLFLQSSYFYIKIFIAFKSYHRDGWPCKPSLLYNYYYHLTHTHTHTHRLMKSLACYKLSQNYQYTTGKYIHLLFENYPPFLVFVLLANGSLTISIF